MSLGAEPCANEVLQFYLPPEDDLDDPVTWFDANSDEDSEGSEHDFSARLLGGVDTKPESSSHMPLTIPICYAAMIPGVFSFFFNAGITAFGAALLIPVLLTVLLMITSVGGIYKVCQARWYWFRLCGFCLTSLGLLSVMGCMVGSNVARLRAMSSETIYDNVNPADAMVGKGIYKFDEMTVVDISNRVPYTNPRDAEYDRSKQNYCIAPVTNSPIFAGHSIVYWNMNQGSCCSESSLKCWPGMAKAGGAKSPNWVAEFYSPAANASGVKRFALNKNVTVPANAVLIRVLSPDYKMGHIKFIAIYTAVPFLILALLPLFRNVNAKKHEDPDQIPDDVAYTKVTDETTA